MSKFMDYDNYEVYADGRIWSYYTNKFLKPQTNKYGYQVVGLTDNEGKRKTYFVHRIVYEAVSGEPIPEHLEVNHRSEDKAENSFSNLELLSHNENINFGTRNTRVSKTMTNGKTSKSVGAFQNGQLIMTFQSTQEARRQGFNQGAVSACCRNCYLREGNNIYKGYEWRYI